MRLYETTFITDSRLPESEIEGEIKRVEDTIKSGGGEIVETQRWGVRRLAYEIEKQKQGYYAHFLYKSEPDVPSQLETGFRVNENVMRFLTVVSEVDLEERKRRMQEGESTEETDVRETDRRQRSGTSEGQRSDEERKTRSSDDDEGKKED